MELFTPSSFLAVFGLIFLAEMGDKTQMVSMMLATRFDWKRAFLGIAAAFALINVLAVFAGQLVFQWLEPGWIRLAAAGLFAFFGVSTLKDRNEGEDGEEGGGGGKERGPILTSFLMIFLAEMGDKTQLATATLAAQHRDFLSVFAGSTLALWLVSLMGMGVGVLLAKRIPAKWVKTAAGVLFLAFGAVYLVQGLAMSGIVACPGFLPAPLCQG